MRPMITLCVLAASAGCATLATGPETVAATTSPTATPEAAAPNPELRALFEADQADRRNPQADFASVGARDAERRKRVLEILDAGGATVAEDFLHAAMIFQHGSSVTDFERAHALALEAIERDAELKQAKWLAAASKDRSLMQQGKPQLYGTQFVRAPDGRWALHPVDPSITDDERARWNVPPLEVSRQRLEKMNARSAPR